MQAAVASKLSSSMYGPRGWPRPFCNASLATRRTVADAGVPMPRVNLKTVIAEMFSGVGKKRTRG
eukprot:2259183-Lingulodinium_polyedra.AAC.1